MTQLTRRAFLEQTPVGAATLGLLPVMPALAAVRRASEGASPRLSAASPGSMVIHVKDIATGEMTLLVGTREFALRDPRLVAGLIEATR
jgi:hypothetical protein